MDDIQHLSKAERKKLKRERRKDEKSKRGDEWVREKRNRRLKFWGKIALAIIVVGFVVNLWISSGPKMEITPLEYNFGQVSVRKGIVNTNMTVRNTGKTDLMIKGMETSCSCTSAALIIDGIEGPKFSMKGHGTNPRDWSASIPPGGEAQLKVYYDPGVHKDMRGPVTREIIVSSNVPFAWSKILRIRANQVR